MIRNIEIKQIAREFGVPESTIEKDYANAWKNSLGHQLKDLPDFAPIFDEVIDLLIQMEITSK